MVRKYSKGSGWHGESQRHSLASKGIKTSYAKKKIKRTVLVGVGVGAGLGAIAYAPLGPIGSALGAGVGGLAGGSAGIDYEPGISIFEEVKSKNKKKINSAKEDGFARDSKGKISQTELSSYGKDKLRLLDGAQLHFTDSTLTVKGNKLVNEKGKVIQKIDNDRLVNKIIFKII